MTWLALDAPPLTLLHPNDRPLALAVMGLLRYRVPAGAGRARRPVNGPVDGYERLLRRLLDLSADAPPLIHPETRGQTIAAVWALLNQLANREQAEMLALHYGLAVEPTEPLTLAQAGSVHSLTAAQTRRLCQKALAGLRANPALADLRQTLTRGEG